MSQQAEMKEKLMPMEINEAAFVNNDEKTYFYTGIPNFGVLVHVFNLVSPHLKVKHNKLSY